MESWRMPFGTSSSFMGNGDLLFLGAGSLMGVEETRKRGQFMLHDEDYFDDQSPEKKRRLTPEQVQLLEKSFEEENSWSRIVSPILLRNWACRRDRWRFWFQNRRARWKAKQLEKDFHQLKSSYGSLVSIFESVLHENLDLKSQLLSLRQMSEAKEAESDALRKQSGESLPKEATLSAHVTARGGGAVADEDSRQPGSYIPDNHFPSCTADVYCLNSEEDDGYRSDISTVFGSAEELGSLIWF